MKRLAIIGAGFSGLVLGYMLKSRFDITIFEKSRGLGGRMATRRIEDMVFDHGVPFFRAKTKEFQDFLKPFIKQGVVTEWNARFAQIIDYKVKEIYHWDSAPPHFVATPNMTSFPKILSQELNTVFEKRITGILSRKDSSELMSGEESLGTYDYVITTIPCHQALEILPDDCAYLEMIKMKKMHPCFALMISLVEDPNLDFDAAIVKGSDISWISVMKSKLARPLYNNLVVLSTNLWAEKNLESNKEAASKHLIGELEKLIGINSENINYVDLHKWRYANIQKQEGPKSFYDNKKRIGSIGDWCVEGKIEGAFLSAQDIAHLQIW